jgi:hypothetical protein
VEPRCHRVLQALALRIVKHLLRGRLPHIQHCLARDMAWADLLIHRPPLRFAGARSRRTTPLAGGAPPASVPRAGHSPADCPMGAAAGAVPAAPIASTSLLRIASSVVASSPPSCAAHEGTVSARSCARSMSAPQCTRGAAATVMAAQCA